MKYIKIKCATCGSICKKPKGEIARQKRKGRNIFYCDLKCSGKQSHEHLLQYDNSKYLISGNRKDKYSDFRWYLRNCARRTHKGPCNLTLKFLLKLWELQKGICPFTGWKLVLRTFTDSVDLMPSHASIDRIDNAKGYIEGNVRFISVMANFARNRFSDKDLITFCKAVSNHE